MSKHWELAEARFVDHDRINGLLADGWEPFAITGTELLRTVYHFRRRVTEDASAREVICRCTECKAVRRTVPGERHKKNAGECAGRWAEIEGEEP